MSRTAAVTVSVSAAFITLELNAKQHSSGSGKPRLFPMKFPAPLRKGKLIKRYKRFLADVEFDLLAYVKSLA